MRSSPITDAATLGLVLRHARIQRGLTQSDLAESLDVHQSYIAGMEAGKSVKAVERLLEMARETGVTIIAEVDDDPVSGPRVNR